jgi:hypothetical protein
VALPFGLGRAGGAAGAASGGAVSASAAGGAVSASAAGAPFGLAVALRVAPWRDEVRPPLRPRLALGLRVGAA